MLKVHAKKLNAVEILSLEGQLINGDTESLSSAVRLSPAGDIILDFSNVTVLQLREQTLANGIHFKLLNVSERLSRLFEITRLNTVFEINSGRELLMAA
jgi:anti-anti-sigma regulatory factor